MPKITITHLPGAEEEAPEQPEKLNRITITSWPDMPTKDETFGFIGETANNLQTKAGDVMGIFDDPGVDKKSGIDDAWLRFGASRADTDEEEDRYYSEEVGAEGFGRTKDGEIYLTPSGMERLGYEDARPDMERQSNPNIQVDESGINILGDIFGDVGADILPFLASTGASLALGPFGPVVGAVGSGLAGAGTKAVDEGIEYLQGRNLQTGGEVAGDIAMEGASAAIGDTASRGLSASATKIFGPNRNVVKHSLAPNTGFWDALNPFQKSTLVKRPPLTTAVPDDYLKLAEESMAMGGRPSISSATGGESPLASRFQGIGDAIFGNPRGRINTEALQKNIDRFQDKASGGVPLERVQGKLIDTDKNLLNAKVTTEKQVDDTFSQATESIRRANASKGNEAVGESVQEAIFKAKGVFDVEAQALYKEVDDIAGNAPIVKTSFIKEALDNILAGINTRKEIIKVDGVKKEILIPMLTDKTFIEYVTDLQKLAPRMTFQKAQSMRSALSKEAYSPHLLKAAPKHFIGQLKKGVDDAIEMSPDVPIDAIDALQRATNYYAAGMKTYDDIVIDKLTLDVRRSGAIAPEKIVQYMGSNSMTAAKLKKIKNIIGNNNAIWGDVQKQTVNNMLDKAVGIDGGVNAGSLLSQIKNMGEDRFKILVGKSGEEIKGLIEGLAAKGGKISVEDMADGNFKQALIAANKARDNYLDFHSQNYIKGLQETTGSPAYAGAVDYLFNLGGGKIQKGNRLALRPIIEAKRIFGEESKEWIAVKSNMMMRLLESFSTKTGDGLKVILTPGEFTKALQSRQPVLMEALGKEHFSELEKFGRIASFLAGDKTPGGGLVAATQALAPLNALKGGNKLQKLTGAMLALQKIRLLSKFLSSKNGIRYFTEGFGGLKTGKWERFGGHGGLKVMAQVVQKNIREGVNQGWEEGSNLGAAASEALNENK